MAKKFLIFFLAGVSALLVFSLCTGGDQQESGGEVSAANPEVENAADHESAGDYSWDSSETVSIELRGDSASSDGSGAIADGSAVRIVSAGTYLVSGTLNDGQIVVETEDERVVRLVFQGVSVNNSGGAALYVKKAEEVVIVLGEGSENYLSDGETYFFEAGSDEPNAALFSKADLTIYGEGGSLTVAGNYNDGISGKDGLIIKNAILDLTAADDGIRGKDYLVIDGSEISVEAGSNGLKSDNDTDDSMGYVSIKDSAIEIVSGGDAISAETDAIIAGGNFDLTSGGGSSASASRDVSKKGIKALVSLVIEDGEFAVNSADDALHSNGEIIINGGVFAISSGDDALHADSSIEINGGDLYIAKSFEGIESAEVTINGGDIYIVSSDDGINIAGGNDGSAMGRPGQGAFGTDSGDYCLYLNGGYIYINANGDGVDSNGSIVMTGGTVIVNGPTSNNNGAIDYLGSFEITGGFLLGVGSSGMAQAPSQSSSQYSVLASFSSAQQAGTLINIRSESGEDVLVFAPAKQYQSVVFSSPALENGETYVVYLGGSSSGSGKNGLYEDGTYVPGTENASFTVSGTVTTVNASMNGMMPGNMRGGTRRW